MTTSSTLDLPHPDYFVLASSSPRRHQLLAAFNIPFTVLAPNALPNTPDVNETPHPNEEPAALVQRLSAAKANAVATYLLKKDVPEPLAKVRAQNWVVIAADTVVVFGNQILGKPTDPDQAITMLKQLRDNRHTVYSGLTVAKLPNYDRDEIAVVTNLHQSHVWMRPYTNAEIEAYVAGGSPLDKAGAYGIQDNTFTPVDRITGCFASVMGLPLGQLATALNAMGLLLPSVALVCSRQIGKACCQSTPCGF